ncbi:MAG: hypothetical protein OHK0052_00820 [Anaerolineales bacterium]
MDISDSRIVILGLGLIGGSLALALQGKLAGIAGFDANPQVCAAAREAALVARVYDDMRALPPADALILAAPVRANLRLLNALSAHYPHPAIVFDVSSTKRAILHAMQTLPPHFDPIGGHPMSGKTHSGFQHAEANLFHHAPFALCPLTRSSPRARAWAEALVQTIGARPLWMDAETHDFFSAHTSHAPYVIAAALAHSTPSQVDALIGPGWRSSTRLANSSPQMMRDILLTNRDNVLDALTHFQARLQAWQTALQTEDESALDALMQHAQQAAARDKPCLISPHEETMLPENFFATLEDDLTTTATNALIRLDVGSPDLPPPQWVLKALLASAAQPSAHAYQPHRGTYALREAWSLWYARRFGVSLHPETQILPLLGSKEGIFHLSLAWLRPGDVALVPDPGYMTYARGALAAGAEVFRVPLRRELGNVPDLEAIPVDVLRRAKILWLNYPNNPTGAVTSLTFLQQAVRFAEHWGLLLAHDAAYSAVTFDGYSAPSLLQAAGGLTVGVEFNSLSKSHHLAGWRSGAMLGRADAVAALHRVKMNADSGHFAPILQASGEVLNADAEAWLLARNALLGERRRVLTEGLRALGLTIDLPLGGLYVWFESPRGWDADDFVVAMRNNARVSLTPGSVFGEFGRDFVRATFTAPAAVLREAVARLGDVLFG